jgi:hypothetical protein
VDFADGSRHDAGGTRCGRRDAEFAASLAGAARRGIRGRVRALCRTKARRGGQQRHGGIVARTQGLWHRRRRRGACGSLFVARNRARDCSAAPPRCSSTSIIGEACSSPRKLAERITPATKAILAATPTAIRRRGKRCANSRNARLDPARGLDRGDRLDLPGPHRRQLRGLRGVRLLATRALCCGEGGIVVTDDARHRRQRCATRAPCVRPNAARCSSARPAQSGGDERAGGSRRARAARRESTRSSRSARSSRACTSSTSSPSKASRTLMSRRKSMPRTGCSTSCTSARAFRNPPATRSSRTCAANASRPTRFAGRLHTQRHYLERNPANARGKLLVTEKLADRAVALPFHRHLERAANRIHRVHLEGCIDERRRRRRDFLNTQFPRLLGD